MAKLNRSLYNKEQYRALKREIALQKNPTPQLTQEQRAAAKAAKRARKMAQNTVQPTAVPVSSPVPPKVNLNLKEWGKFSPVDLAARPRLDGLTAFVLGNGLSRKDIKLDHLPEWGKIYGCNALYREFTPDFLIAVDAKMILEICESNWQLHHTVWTNPNKNMEKYKGLNFFKPSQGWSSGPTALWLATHHGHKTLYILGFDYVGTQEGKLNNLYGSTRNYRKNTDPATYHGNWLRQTTIVIQKNPKNQYIRVVQDDRQGFQAQELRRFNNYSEMTVCDFRNAFCKPRPVQN